MSSQPTAKSPLRVLMTGATGYIGRALLDRWVGQSISATAVVRDSSSRESASLDPSIGFRVHSGTTESLVEIVADVEPDVVIHLATMYRRQHAVDEVTDLINSNVLFGTQLLEAMRLASCNRLVTMGSYFQFRDGADYSPVNLYAATKQAFEDIVHYYVDAHGFSVLSLVLFDVYGPNDRRRRLMNALRDAATGGDSVLLPGGDIELDLLHVDDATAAIDRAMRLMAAGVVEGALRYSARPNERVRLSEVLAVFEEAAQGPVPHEWGAYPMPARVVTSPWGGTRLPGWEPRVDLREGVRRLLDSSDQR